MDGLTGYEAAWELFADDDGQAAYFRKLREQYPRAAVPRRKLPAATCPIHGVASLDTCDVMCAKTRLTLEA